MRLFAPALIIALSTCLLGCPPSVEPTLSSIQENIFSPGCNFDGCHDSSAGGELSLEPGNSFAQLVNVAPDDTTAQGDGYLRVDPGSPSTSYLYLLLDPDTVPAYAELMPKTPPVAIDPDELEAVRLWIEEGAQDN